MYTYWQSSLFSALICRLVVYKRQRKQQNVFNFKFLPVFPVWPLFFQSISAKVLKQEQPSNSLLLHYTHGEGPAAIWPMVRVARDRVGTAVHGEGTADPSPPAPPTFHPWSPRVPWEREGGGLSGRPSLYTLNPARPILPEGSSIFADRATTTKRQVKKYILHPFCQFQHMSKLRTKKRTTDSAVSVIRQLNSSICCNWGMSLSCFPRVKRSRIYSTRR